MNQILLTREFTYLFLPVSVSIHMFVIQTIIWLLSCHFHTNVTSLQDLPSYFTQLFQYSSSFTSIHDKCITSSALMGDKSWTHRLRMVQESDENMCILSNVLRLVQSVSLSKETKDRVREGQNYLYGQAGRKWHQHHHRNCYVSTTHLDKRRSYPSFDVVTTFFLSCVSLCYDENI